MAKTDAEHIGEYFKKRVLEFKPDLCSLVLFGSRSGTDYGKSSDVDLLLIFDAINDREEQSLSKLKFETAIKFGTSIDIVPLTKIDFELNIKNRMPLLLEIWRKHKIIFDRQDYFKKHIGAVGILVKTGKLSFNKWINCWVAEG